MKRLAIIGAGDIVPEHLKVIAACPGLKVEGIMSRKLSKAQAMAQRFDIAYATDDIDQLVSKIRPDALMVLVSADQTYGVIRKVLSFGLPLFVEKPCGISVEESKDLAEMAKRANVRVMVGLNRRYFSIFHKGLEIIRQHGPLMGVSVEGHERIWRQEGKDERFEKNILANWIFVNSIHTIDLLRFFGGEISNLSVINHRYRQPKGDQIVAIMELGCGAIGQYNAHWYSPGGWSVTLYGKGVTVEFKPLEQGRWTNQKFEVHDIKPDEVDTLYKPGFYSQINAFREFLETGKMPWPMQDLDGAYQTMHLAGQMTSHVVDRSLVS